MISQHYKDFKVRDYMDENILKNNVFSNLIDCSLGTNPFIKEDMIKKYIDECKYEINKYPSLQYELLKDELYNLWKIYDITKENISFESGTMGILRNISEILIQERTKVLGIAPQFPRFISEILQYKNVAFHPNINTETIVFSPKEIYKIFDDCNVKYKFIKIN